jgi:hypothetical protein
VVPGSLRVSLSGLTENFVLSRMPPSSLWRFLPRASSLTSRLSRLEPGSLAFVMGEQDLPNPTPAAMAGPTEPRKEFQDTTKST